jgi:transaldolase / glucose-6-phosphate isomerase
MTQSMDNPLNNFSQQVDRQELHLGPTMKAVEERIREWKDQDIAGRLWRKDPAVWSQAQNTQEIQDRLGWLYLPQSMGDQSDEITAFAEEIRKENYLHVVLLGMGGSSLAPEVFQETFGNSQGYPKLSVLDSTHPGAIESLTRRIDPLKTLFLVSSKSGTTLETLTLYYYFWNQLRERTNDPGRNFVAVTDPGTPLARLAEERRFRRTFLAPPDIGGRYSVLSVFGLVPAALIGIDISQLLEKARQMAEACGSGVDPSQNPGIALGATLGELGMSGRDKITFVTGAELGSFPLWLEQLIAESTGKNDKGLIPVAGETLGAPEVYGADRVFVRLSLQKPVQNEELKRLQTAGHPVLNIALTELSDLGQEFFRWEMAVAAAGAAFQIHPFDQPDVQLAKDLARKAMESTGGGKSQAELLSLSRRRELTEAAKRWLGTVRPGDYFAIQAYLEPEPRTAGILERVRNAVRDRFQVATTIGYGPRFLHSTGQLHKGGPNTGLFLQLVDQPASDLTIPEKGYTFGTLIRAQAEGDFAALKSRDRRVIRIDLGENAAEALAELQNILVAGA